jgi:hypothetical protein
MFHNTLLNDEVSINNYSEGKDFKNSSMVFAFTTLKSPIFVRLKADK